MPFVVRLQLLFHAGLRQPRDLQDATLTRTSAADGVQPRSEIRGDHPLQLVRNAGKHPHILRHGARRSGGPLHDEVKPRRRPALVVERRLAHEDVRLTLVDLGHGPAACCEPRGDRVDDRLVHFHRQAERLGERLPSQVVLRRSETAGDHEHVSAVECIADLGDEIGQQVSDDGLADDRDGEALQRRSDLQRVRVDPGRPEHLGADGDDCCASVHGRGTIHRHVLMGRDPSTALGMTQGFARDTGVRSG